MLQTLLSFNENPKHFDATDALAVAMCHHFQMGSLLPAGSKSMKDWKDFMKQNPGRISLKH
jgi:crossover junction endodeoxyribonuclease RuvC